VKGIPAIWFALIVLALLAALTFWIDRTVQPPQPKRDGSTRHDPDYIVGNFTSSRADVNGDPRYSLAGIEMRHFPDDDSTALVRPEFAQFSLKKPTVRIEGLRGTISANGENVYFMDNVKVVRAATPTKGELTVLTDYLHIVPDQDFVETDRPVTILQAPRTVIRGTGMEYRKQDGELKLFKRVKVHYERPDAPPAPPLKIEQLAPKPAGAAAKARAEPPKRAAAKAKRSRPRKVAGNKHMTKKPELNAGKTKTRIRRPYANTAN